MANKTWPDEHLALVADWVKTYPKGGSFDKHRVKAERTADWQRVLSTGRSESAIWNKGYYITTKETNPKKVHATGGRSKRLNPVTGKYECAFCPRIFDKPQELGSHVRYTHPDKTPRAKKQAAIKRLVNMNGVSGMPGLSVTVPDELVGQMVIVNPDGTVKRAELINGCPYCLKSLRTIIAAANIEV